MAARSRGGSIPQKQQRAPSKAEKRSLKRKREEEDLDKVEKAIADLDPKSAELKNFADLPLREATASGLRASHFEVMTDIQRLTIPLSLKGNDILGAAKTGSGKTLAFLVPLLEKLYRARWTEFDGLGALVLSPTRELAVQTFEVLRKIGRNHAFSAGLVIGGKSLKEEADRLTRMNILIGTPGRILQHLDQTAGFDVSNLQMLVLDEADRIMDMGFQRDVDALIEHLPKTRQTLLFSATQSKRVSDLARLSLKDPEYVSAHAEAASATPSGLQQYYAVTPLPEKLASLWGFLKSNLKAKMIVFISSGKQVRFVFEAFKRMQPGIPLLHLHGRQRQSARLEITARFAAMKSVCLLATDVVARGVDFPKVGWVVQMDCPEDAETYIHRVGRTARYESDGRAVLFLDPSEEEGFLKRLEQKKIPIQKVHVREKKKRDITALIQAMCFKNTDLKYLAQKSFVSYTRSVHLQRDKDVFKLDQLDLNGFAMSLGLPGAPQIKFQKGEDLKRIKNMARAAMSSGSDTDDSDATGKRKKKEVRTKVQKMMERQNQDVLSSHYKKLVKEDDLDDADQDFLSVKRVLNHDDLDASAEGAAADDGAEHKVVTLGKTTFVVDSHRREKVLKSKKKLLKYMDRGTKLVFDDDGNAHPIYELQDEEDFRQEGPAEALRRRFVDTEAERVREADVEDKELARQKRREKRIKRKERERAEMEGEDGPGDAMLVRLPSPDGEDREGQHPLGNESGDYSDGDEEEEAVMEARAPPRKKAKKWFQDGSEDDDPKKAKHGRKVRFAEMDQAPETLEDYEALATGLLDD